MLSSSASATPAAPDGRRLLRQKKIADGTLQSRALTEITNTPRRAFTDLTNHLKSQNSDSVGTGQNVVSKQAQQKYLHDGLLLQEKSSQLLNVEFVCKDDDSIEHCFGSSEPTEWKAEIDVMDYLTSLHDPDFVSSETEEDPMSKVPLVAIPHLPEGFFDDMPDTFFDDSSYNVDKDELPLIEAP